MCMFPCCLATLPSLPVIAVISAQKDSPSGLAPPIASAVWMIPYDDDSHEAAFAHEARIRRHIHLSA